MEFSKESISSLISLPSGQEKKGQLYVPVGYTMDEYLFEDFAQIPNMLISGTTGSGKTCFIQTVVTELMMKYSPDEAVFLIYDSKTVDYNIFNENSSMLYQVINQTREITDVFIWLEKEATMRLQKLNDIDQFPHIFFLLDDFSVIARETPGIIDKLSHLFQIARLTRIHFWIITSTPTTNIISTELKANIHCRIAFNSATKVISRIILDENGAETLLFPGEIILKEYSNSKRCMAVFFNESDLYSLVEAVKQIRPFANYPISLSNEVELEIEGDEYFEEAKRLVILEQKVSVSFLQRSFQIGFNRAVSLMNQLEKAGIIGPDLGVKPREILVKNYDAMLMKEEIPDISPYDERSSFPSSFEIHTSDGNISVENNIITFVSKRNKMTPTTVESCMIKEFEFKEPRLLQKGKITVVYLQKQQKKDQKILNSQIVIQFDRKEADGIFEKVKAIAAEMQKPIIIT